MPGKSFLGQRAPSLPAAAGHRGGRGQEERGKLTNGSRLPSDMKVVCVCVRACVCK